MLGSLNIKAHPLPASPSEQDKAKARRCTKAGGEEPGPAAEEPTGVAWALLAIYSEEGVGSQSSLKGESQYLTAP